MVAFEPFMTSSGGATEIANKAKEEAAARKAAAEAEARQEEAAARAAREEAARLERERQAAAAEAERVEAAQQETIEENQRIAEQRKAEELAQEADIPNPTPPADEVATPEEADAQRSEFEAAQTMAEEETNEEVVDVSGFAGLNEFNERLQNATPDERMEILSAAGVSMATDYINETHTARVTQERIETQEAAQQAVEEDLNYENISSLRSSYNLNNPQEREAWLSFIDQSLNSGELTADQHMALRASAFDAAVENLDHDTIMSLQSTYDMDDPEQAEAFMRLNNEIVLGIGEGDFGVYTGVMTEEEEAAYRTGVETRRLDSIWGLPPSEQHALLAEAGFNDNDAAEIIAQQDDMINLVSEAGDLGAFAMADAGSLGVTIEREPEEAQLIADALGVDVSELPPPTNIELGLNLLQEEGRIPDHYLPFMPQVVQGYQTSVQAMSNVQFAMTHSDQISDDVVAGIFDENGVTDFNENVFNDFKEENQWNPDMFGVNDRSDGIGLVINNQMTTIESNPTAESVDQALAEIRGFTNNVYNTPEDEAVLAEYIASLETLHADLVDAEAASAGNADFQFAEGGFNAVRDHYNDNIRGGIIKRGVSELFGGEFSDSSNQEFIAEREQELTAIGYLSSLETRTPEQDRQLELLLTSITGIDSETGIETGLGHTEVLEDRSNQYYELTKDNTKNYIVLGAGITGAVAGSVASGGNVGVGFKVGAATAFLVGGTLIVVDDATGSDYSVGDYAEVLTRSTVMGGIGGATGGLSDKLILSGGATRLLGAGLLEVGAGSAMTSADTFISTGGDLDATWDSLTTISELDLALGALPVGLGGASGLFRGVDDAARVTDDAVAVTDDIIETGGEFTVRPNLGTGIFFESDINDMLRVVDGTHTPFGIVDDAVESGIVPANVVDDAVESGIVPANVVDDAVESGIVPANVVDDAVESGIVPANVVDDAVESGIVPTSVIDDTTSPPVIVAANGPDGVNLNLVIDNPNGQAVIIDPEFTGGIRFGNEADEFGVTVVPPGAQNEGAVIINALGEEGSLPGLNLNINGQAIDDPQTFRAIQPGDTFQVNGGQTFKFDEDGTIIRPVESNAEGAAQVDIEAAAITTTSTPDGFVDGDIVPSEYIGMTFDTPNGPVRIIESPDGVGGQVVLDNIGANVNDALNSATRTTVIGGTPFTDADPLARQVLQDLSPEQLDVLNETLTNLGVRNLQPFSGGRESIVLAADDGLVVKLQPGAINRPEIDQVLQPIHTGEVGGVTFEVMPRLETNASNPGSITMDDFEDLRVQVESQGYEFVDILDESDLDQLGRLPDGTLVILDPHGIRLRPDTTDIPDFTPQTWPPNGQPGIADDNWWETGVNSDVSPAADFPLGGSIQVNSSDIGRVIDLDDGTSVIIHADLENPGFGIVTPSRWSASEVASNSGFQNSIVPDDGFGTGANNGFDEVLDDGLGDLDEAIDEADQILNDLRANGIEPEGLAAGSSEPGIIRIGRADDNDIVVPNAIASRNQAEITPLGNGQFQINHISTNPNSQTRILRGGDPDNVVTMNADGKIGTGLNSGDHIEFGAGDTFVFDGQTLRPLDEIADASPSNVIRIGNNSDNDFVLGGAGTSRNHAELTLLDNGQAQLNHISTSNGIETNVVHADNPFEGVKLNSTGDSVILNPGDGVHFGGNAFRFNGQTLEPVSFSDLINPSRFIPEGSLSDGVTLGRQGDIVLDPANNSISRNHGTLQFNEAGQLFYRNASPNGTLLNGRPVDSEWGQVADGDLLTFSGVTASRNSMGESLVALDLRGPTFRVEITPDGVKLNPVAEATVPDVYVVDGFTDINKFAPVGDHGQLVRFSLENDLEVLPNIHEIEAFTEANNLETALRDVLNQAKRNNNPNQLLNLSLGYEGITISMIEELSGIPRTQLRNAGNVAIKDELNAALRVLDPSFNPATATVQDIATIQRLTGIQPNLITAQNEAMVRSMLANRRGSFNPTSIARTEVAMRNVRIADEISAEGVTIFTAAGNSGLEQFDPFTLINDSHVVAASSSRNAGGLADNSALSPNVNEIAAGTVMIDNTQIQNFRAQGTSIASPRSLALEINNRYRSLFGMELIQGEAVPVNPNLLPSPAAVQTLPATPQGQQIQIFPGAQWWRQ